MIVANARWALAHPQVGTASVASGGRQGCCDVRQHSQQIGRLLVEGFDFLPIGPTRQARAQAFALAVGAHAQHPAPGLSQPILQLTFEGLVVSSVRHAPQLFEQAGEDCQAIGAQLGTALVAVTRVVHCATEAVDRMQGALQLGLGQA